MLYIYIYIYWGAFAGKFVFLGGVIFCGSFHFCEGVFLGAEVGSLFLGGFFIFLDSFFGGSRFFERIFFWEGEDFCSVVFVFLFMGKS